MDNTNSRIAELKQQAANAGVMAPSGPWVLEGPQSWDRMLTLWEGPKGHNFAQQDLPLLMSWIPEPPLRVLEVGGGYGKLARLIITMVGRDNIDYTLVDAVPESLAYAERDMGGYPCQVVPVWKFEPEHYNLCINIASMQEMSQEQVDYYIALFDRVTEIGGIIFLMNSWDYHGRVYRYPNTWRLLHKGFCHRSLTPNYPLEVFEKCTHDLGFANDRKRVEYYERLERRYQGCFLDGLQAKRGLQEARQEIARLRLHSNLLLKAAMTIRSKVYKMKGGK